MTNTIPISSKDYSQHILRIIGAMIPNNLTDFEIKILSTMIDNDIKTLDTDTRLKVRLLIDTSEYNFNNYIKKLKEKGILIETKYGLGIHPNVLNAVHDRELVIKYNVN